MTRAEAVRYFNHQMRTAGTWAIMAAIRRNAAQYGLRWDHVRATFA